MAKERDLMVKWKRLEPVQHKSTWASQQEWMYDELEIEDFAAWLKEQYQEYKRHNWIYRWQSIQMKQSLDHMQRNTIVLQWDYGSGYSHRQQNSGTCNHPKQSHLLIFYTHHSPCFESGKKVSHTTDVVTFWIADSDDHTVSKDCHSIMAALEWITARYVTKDETRVIPVGEEADFVGWADGCGEQNKGRRTVRCLTEFPSKQ
jgi:hypothetical protein